MIGCTLGPGEIIRCRRLTKDAAHLRVGDRVHVDFAGFVWDASFVYRHMPRAARVQAGMREGEIVRERRFLSWRLGPDVMLYRGSALPQAARTMGLVPGTPEYKPTGLRLEDWPEIP